MEGAWVVIRLREWDADIWRYLLDAFLVAAQVVRVLFCQ
jgi:hypothetical protein